MEERKQPVLIPSPNLEPVALDEAPSLLLVDKVGDPKNLIYGALDRHAIPNYFRSGAGSVVGSTPGNKIDRYASSEKAVVLSANRHGLPSKREKNSFSQLTKTGTRKLRIRSDKDHYHEIDVDVAADFVPLRPACDKKSMRRGDGSTSDSSESSNGTVGHYRSIDGKAKAINGPDDKDLLYGSDTSISDYKGARRDYVDEPKKRKRIELVRKTEADPTNGGAWLDLIKHQDVMLGIGPDHLESKLTNAEIQSNADVKISIYEKAIERVLDPNVREKLLMDLIDEGSKVWETSKLSSKWRLWLRTYPEYLGLWIKYLDYTQTTFSSFNYEEVRTVYDECLQVLQRARTREPAAIAENDTLYENQVYVLVRMMVFMREAGFTENAIAAWQAILEWQMFKPSRFQSRECAMGGSKVPEALSAFEYFWESEVPRIGETGAEGWASFMANNGNPPQPCKDYEHLPEGGTQVFDQWAKWERYKSWKSRVVARTIDEVEESDPYRVILFSDVRGFLIDPPESSSGLALLFQALLIFCHLTPFSTEHANDCTRLWWRDPFLRNDVLHQLHNTFSVWRVQNAGDAEDGLGPDGVAKDLPLNMSHQNDPFSFPMPDCRSSLESLFAAPGTWFSAFSAWHHQYVEDHGPIKIAWIRRILEAIVLYTPNEEYLVEYYLAFELNVSPETVKRTAKGLIKRRPDSLRLYNAYALIEYRLGNASGAENVMSTAINMGRGLLEAERRNAVLLWHTWVWELLSSGQTSQALRRLMSYSEEIVNVNLPEPREDAAHESSMTSPSLLLRTQSVRLSHCFPPYPTLKILTTNQTLTTARDQLLALSLPYLAMHYADLLILLTYLTTSSISSTLSTFHQNLAHIPRSTLAHELLHQFFCKIVSHHATYTPSFSPSVVRSSIAESIKAYPNNTIFLSLYAWIESRFRIDDRVRSIIKDVVLTNHLSHDRGVEPPSVISHFFAIYTELRRSLTLGSNTNTIRATFERAVREGSVGAHSAGLWKLYFLFEWGRGDRKKAREVFWRGITACPWAKELYMVVFDGPKEIGMNEVELRGVLEMMEDKGLRIHVRVDDVREKMTTRKGLPV